MKRLHDFFYMRIVFCNRCKYVQEVENVVDYRYVSQACPKPVPSAEVTL